MATKVFVGNLSFSTTVQELKDAFSQVGKVVEANIITRKGQSLGYGFVTFETEEEAKRAVEQMSKKEIAARQINVEIAAPRDPNAPRPARNNRYYGRGRGGRRGGGRGRGRGYRGGQGYRGRGRGGRGYRARRPRANRQNTNATPAEPSKTTLFVANLPYTITDDGLKQLFSAYNIKSAHVVKLKRTGRSRGYGFVEFHDEETQKKALAEMDNKTVESPNGPRQISVKIANSSSRPQQSENATTNQAAPADASAAPENKSTEPEPAKEAASAEAK